MRIKIKPCIKIKYESEEEALEEAKRKKGMLNQAQSFANDVE